MQLLFYQINIIWIVAEVTIILFLATLDTFLVIPDPSGSINRVSSKNKLVINNKHQQNPL